MSGKVLRAGPILAWIWLSFAACGSTKAPPIGQPGGDTTSCTTASDCDWGEIDHEIVSASDCPCLYGCGYLALNKATIDRRKRQYGVLCSPSHDGKGEACGIDDCAIPPPLACVAGHCMAEPDAH